MKGELHHTSMGHARLVGKAATQPAYELVQIDYYPAMIAGGSASVVGELYEVDDHTLAHLDELEEVPDYYERLPITLADGTEAYTYIMPRARVVDARPIPSGSFRARF